LGVSTIISIAWYLNQTVMRGLVPGIHVFLTAAQDVDGRIPATPKASPGFRY
jgi:hypothetical protein